MGYNSTVSGTINIVRLSPPELPEELVEQIEKFGLKIQSQYRGLSPDAVDRLEAIENLYGYVTVTDHALHGTQESNKVYWLDKGLKEALAIIEADGCYASGFLVIAGEEAGDIWRYLIVDGKEIKEEAAVLAWPDGSKVVL